MLSKNCEHFANMLVYGVNFSEQVEQKKEFFGARVCVPGGAAITGMTGLGVWSAIGWATLAPITGGLSLVGVGVSAGLAAVGDVAIIEVCRENSEINNSKTEFSLKSEIGRTNGLLRKKSDCETEEYKKQYLQEVPSKEYCRIM